MNKLSAYGLGNSARGWLRDFLNSRTQRVAINGFISDEIPVTSGVPQGSALRLTLFLLYINDLPDLFLNSDTTCKLFADDVKLYNQSPTQLQNWLDKTSEWNDKWQLQLATEKCLVFSLVGCKRSLNLYEYHVSIYELTRIDTFRDLDILMDSFLRFNKHIDNITKKAATISRMIISSFTSRNQDILKRAFCTYVRPILEYCSPIWNPHKKYLIDRIERIQRLTTFRGFSCVHEKTQTT